MYVYIYIYIYIYILDFGTTCTVCMVMKAPCSSKPFRKVIVTANAGDSDVCLFRFQVLPSKLNLYATK